MNVHSDTLSIAECLGRMQQAWDAGDAAAFAREFTEDASYVIFAGMVSFGRAAIERDHEPVLAKWQRGSRMVIRVLETRHIAADVAVVVTEGGVGKGSRVPYDKVQTFTMVRDAQGWKCSAFQNTKKNRLFIRMNSMASPR